MDTSQLLARIIGPYMLIAGLALFANRGFYKSMLKDFQNQPLLILIIGAFTLILGLLFVQFHNIWVMDWRVLVTISGWMTLIKGAMALLAPNALTAIANTYKDNETLLYIQAGLVILFGAFMSYMGYFA